MTSTFTLNSDVAKYSSDIEKCSDTQYLSLGVDPHWVWSNLTLTQGWYCIEVSCTFVTSYTSSHKLYYSEHDSFSEEHSVYFEPIGNDKYTCYFYVKRHCQSLRYDPTETEGEINFSHLTITSVEKENVPQHYINQIKKSHDKSFWLTFKSTPVFRIINQLLYRTPKLRQQLLRVWSHFKPQAPASYHIWLEQNERIPSRESQQLTLNSCALQPKVSIIVPVYNTDPKLLSECINSVLAQGYENWQLCLVDDASSQSSTINTLKDYLQCDPRIKIQLREVNGHICHASNDALLMADGEWIALLDHDDLLAPHALFNVILAINNNPSASIFYSDEDKISIDGIRMEPHFKPAWSRDMLLSHNYISHLGVYKKALIDSIGGFRPGYEGSQDYDLLLRAIAKLEQETENLSLSRQIIHIPHILYHWRLSPGSTAINEQEKSYTDDAGLKALQDLMPSLNVDKGKLPNTYKVTWPIPAPLPLVSIIIPTKNSAELVKMCIESIESRTQYTNYEILLIDNQSTDPIAIDYFNQLEQQNRVRLLSYNQVFNYSAINNFAVKHAKGSIIVLMNNDIEVINSDWLNEMVSLCVREEIGCVGAKLYYPNNTIQHAGVILGLGGVAGHSHKHFVKSHDGYFKRLKIRQNLSAVTAACLAVRKSTYLQAGGLNEQQLTVAFNDVDFCLKVRQLGLVNVWTPFAELYHHESISRGAEDTPEKQIRFTQEIDYMKKTWRNELSSDPYYHPNLTRDREDFTLR